MKITLNLSKLVEDGKLTPAEAERLKGLAAQDTGALGINILVGFGVIAVAGSVGALLPNIGTALFLGVAMFALGLALVWSKAQQWWLLAQICTVLGALVFCGAFLAQFEGTTMAMLIVALLLTGAGIIARSGLLIAAAVLALGASLGARSGYWHATYSLAIYEPALTVLLFSALAFAALQFSRRLPAEGERLALMASRTAVLMVNFGFWIGSLWGDRLILLRGDKQVDNPAVIVPDWAFSIAWAAALLAVGIWGVRANRRWVVNVAAVFGAIHFYTQWFERIGANPLSVLVAGLLTLAFAMVLWRFNREREQQSAPTPKSA